MKLKTWHNHRENEQVEYYNKRARETIGRLTDFWAFGCVFMEFITWHIHREIDQVDFFNKRARESISRYDACFHSNTLAGESRAALKPVVATVSFQFV